MKYILLSLFLSISFSKTANAGLYDYEYFEPIAGCLVVGGAMYASAEQDEAMKNGAIGCLAAGIVLWGINEHYDSKYGDQFLGEEDHLEAKITKYNMMENQSNTKKSSSLHFRRVQRVIPPSIDKKGQGIGPRVKEKLILIDDTMRIGE